MSDTRITEALTRFIGQELLRGEDSELDASTLLLELGIIDSLKMVSLMAWIEQEFGLRVPDSEMHPDNFVNISALSAMLTRLQASR